ncbi:unnamed protein product [Sphagnum jensenii]
MSEMKCHGATLTSPCGTIGGMSSSFALLLSSRLALKRLHLTTTNMVFEEPDLDLLLDNDERSILQLEDNLVDFANCRRNNEHDHPPLGQRRFKVHMGIRVLDNLVSARDVKLERAIEVHPSI